MISSRFSEWKRKGKTKGDAEKRGSELAEQQGGGHLLMSKKETKAVTRKPHEALVGSEGGKITGGAVTGRLPLKPGGGRNSDTNHEIKKI